MRLFVGLKVPSSVHPAIQQASSTLVDVLGVKMVPPENWHITLKFIGDVDEGTAGKIEGALSSIRFSPFSVSLSGSGAFPDRHFPRAIWIGGRSEGCERLAVRVEEALSFLRLKKERFAIQPGVYV